MIRVSQRCPGKKLNSKFEKRISWRIDHIRFRIFAQLRRIGICGFNISPYLILNCRQSCQEKNVISNTHQGYFYEHLNT